MVKVKTKMNCRAIQKISSAQLQALEQVVDGKTEGILTEIANEQVVPKQTGELERGAWVDKTGLKRGKVKIVYDTPLHVGSTGTLNIASGRIKTVMRKASGWNHGSMVKRRSHL
ncbi:hypothetical protein M5X17_23545 [Paenibacillus alvei]|uniref:hypothetical protein n=1 Tax=Paenibacillus alvei TaxID=44250 RepID=UPI00227FBE13|nr:hypothetical protein [Paenibacillus alvei]MCY9736697.1 hypothetical protein [Paenibacillus alvei]